MYIHIIEAMASMAMLNTQRICPSLTLWVANGVLTRLGAKSDRGTTRFILSAIFPQSFGEKNHKLLDGWETLSSSKQLTIE